MPYLPFAQPPSNSPQRVQQICDSSRRGFAKEALQAGTTDSFNQICLCVAETGAGEGIRTPDRLITNQVLYQLSYASPTTHNIAQKERDA